MEKPPFCKLSTVFFFDFPIRKEVDSEATFQAIYRLTLVSATFIPRIRNPFLHQVDALYNNVKMKPTHCTIESFGKHFEADNNYVDIIQKVSSLWI